MNRDRAAARDALDRLRNIVEKGVAVRAGQHKLPFARDRIIGRRCLQRSYGIQRRVFRQRYPAKLSGELISDVVY